MFVLLNIRTMANNFLGVLCFKPVPKYCNIWYEGFYVSASGAIQGHHGPLVPHCLQKLSFSGLSEVVTLLTLYQTIRF